MGLQNQLGIQGSSGVIYMNNNGNVAATRAVKITSPFAIVSAGVTFALSPYSTPDFFIPSNGRIGYSGNKTKKFLVRVSLCVKTGAANSTMQIGIGKNTSLINETTQSNRVIPTGLGYTMIACGIVTMAKNDNVSVFFRANATTTVSYYSAFVSAQYLGG